MKDLRITLCINARIYNLSDYYGYNRSLYDFIVLKRIGSSVFEGEYVYINRKVFDDYLHEFKRSSNYHFTDYKTKD